MELNQTPASKEEKVHRPHSIMEGFSPININVSNQNDVLFPHKNVFKVRITSKRRCLIFENVYRLNIKTLYKYKYIHIYLHVKISC